MEDLSQAAESTGKALHGATLSLSHCPLKSQIPPQHGTPNLHPQPTSSPRQFPYLTIYCPTPALWQGSLSQGALAASPLPSPTRPGASQLTTGTEFGTIWTLRLNFLLSLLSFPYQTFSTFGHHLPPHFQTPLRPSKLPWLSGVHAPFHSQPFKLPPGLWLGAGRGIWKPRLLAEFEVRPRPSPGKGPFLTASGALRPPAHSILRPWSHQWQQQVRHGGEAHVRPAVASHSPMRARAVAAVAAAGRVPG